MRGVTSPNAASSMPEPRAWISGPAASPPAFGYYKSLLRRLLRPRIASGS